MWGGVAISEATRVDPAAAGVRDPSLGGLITRATTLTGAAAGQLTGFSVFDQDHSMIAYAQNTVPLALANMSVHFYRLGSGARIAVAMDPSLVGLDGNVITQNVSWDFNNQRLQPYVASGATIGLTSITWANGIGTVVAAAPVPYGVGDYVNISGATNTGTGGVAAVNGNFRIAALTDSTHFTLAMPAAAGVIGTIGGTLLANVGVGALPVKLLEVQASNCMTVDYSPATGFATWNRDGACAVILI
jgi:hypothetical protein